MPQRADPEARDLCIRFLEVYNSLQGRISTSLTSPYKGGDYFAVEIFIKEGIYGTR